VFEMFSRRTQRFRRCSQLQPGKARDMSALKLTYLLPLVISLTTATDGCASLGLLSQSTVIVTKALLRLRNRARSSISNEPL
jgi:hypothetical protein